MDVQSSSEAKHSHQEGRPAGPKTNTLLLLRLDIIIAMNRTFPSKVQAKTERLVLPSHLFERV